MTPKASLSKPKVLAVDDTPANLVALEAVLQDDFELILARSGKEAISVLEQRHDICTILMDVQMPEMNGFDAAERIRNLPGCDDIPIIFITAVYQDSPFVRKGYEVGGVDYFSKPFDPEILKKKLTIYSSFRQRTQVLIERERQIRETEELIKAGRKLSAVLESLPVGVLISDVEGEICQTNEEVSRILKIAEPMETGSYGEVLGWWDHSGRLIKEQNGPLDRALLGRESHNEALHIQCLDGTPKRLLCSASPLRGRDGKVVGAVVVIQDITESKQIEEDFEQRISRLISVGVELEHVAKH